MRHIRRPSGFDLMLPEWPFFKDPLHQKLPLSFPYHVIPLSLLHSSRCPCNHFSTIASSLKIRQQTNTSHQNQVRNGSKQETADRQALSTETFSSILDCYFSTSLSFPQSFTCCRLHALHISSPREETHLFQICTLVGTSKEDFSNFHLYRKP